MVRELAEQERDKLTDLTSCFCSITDSSAGTAVMKSAE